jgi:hypothetical protein
LIRMMEDILKKTANIKYVKKQKGDVRDTWADVSKAKAKLNWKPRVNINKGLKRFEEWFIFNKDYVCIYDGEERGKPKYRVICELFGTLVTLIVLDTEVNVIKTVWMPKSWEKEIYKKRGELR